MLVAGIQAESGLDPRLKHSGVTIQESHLFAPTAIFEGAQEGHEEFAYFFSELRDLRDLRGEMSFSNFACPLR
jgi:hypothetical protein